MGYSPPDPAVTEDGASVAPRLIGSHPEGGEWATLPPLTRAQVDEVFWFVPSKGEPSPIFKFACWVSLAATRILHNRFVISLLRWYGRLRGELSPIFGSPCRGGPAEAGKNMNRCVFSWLVACARLRGELSQIFKSPCRGDGAEAVKTKMGRVSIGYTLSLIHI